MSQTELPKISVSDPACQFALRRAIDDVLDDLIIAGAGKVALLQDNRPDSKAKLALSRSQIKNVVNQALETQSREAVTNFIRYQMGRQGGGAWRHKTSTRPGKKAFGREIIADLESLDEQPSMIDEATQKVCDAVKEQYQLAPEDEAKLRREARAQLIRLYLGYLNRTYAYCEAMDGENDKSCWDDVESIAKRKEVKPDVR